MRQTVFASRLRITGCRWNSCQPSPRSARSMHRFTTKAEEWKDVLVTVKKQRADQPLEVAFCQDCHSHEQCTTETVSSTTSVNSWMLCHEETHRSSHHRSSLELSSTHLKISSVNTIQCINNNEVDDNTLFGEELLSTGVNSNVSHTSKFADCRGHDFRSPTTVTACQFAQSTWPKAALRSAKTEYRGSDGWQPKSPLTASGRGNQPAGSCP